MMLGQRARTTMGKRWPNIGPTRWPIVGPTWWPYVEPTRWPYVGPMSKITLGQRLFYDVGPTCTYSHGPTLAQHSHAIWVEAARIITGAIKLTSKELLYKESGLTPLSDRRKQHRLILFHKMVHKRAPDYLNELVPPMVSHTYFTRNNQNLKEIKCRTSSYQNSFLPKTVRDWNLLSAETKTIESESAFTLCPKSPSARGLVACLPVRLLFKSM